MNPRMMKQAMRRLGIQQQDIEATEVIIKTPDKEIIIKNPQVAKVNMMGQESIQIIGDIEEEELEKFTGDDIKTVMSQAECSREEAISALESEGDIAGAIISLKKQ